MSFSHYRWSPSTWSVEKSWKYYHGVKPMRSRHPIIWFIAYTHISFRLVLLFLFTRYLSLCSKREVGSFMPRESISLSIVISLHCVTSSTFGWEHHWLIPFFLRFFVCLLFSIAKFKTILWEEWYFNEGYNTTSIHLRCDHPTISLFQCQGFLIFSKDNFC